MATKAFWLWAYSIAPMTYGVRPLAAADQHVAAAKVQVLQVHRPLRFVVFDVLYGAQYGFMAARDNAHHLLRAGAEGRRTLAGIKDPQTPGSARANVNQSTTRLQRRRDLIHHLGNLRQIGVMA